MRIFGRLGRSFPFSRRFSHEKRKNGYAMSLARRFACREVPPKSRIASTGDRDGKIVNGNKKLEARKTKVTLNVTRHVLLVVVSFVSLANASSSAFRFFKLCARWRAHSFFISFLGNYQFSKRANVAL